MTLGIKLNSSLAFTMCPSEIEELLGVNKLKVVKLPREIEKCFFQACHVTFDFRYDHIKAIISNSLTTKPRINLFKPEVNYSGKDRLK